MDHEKQSCRLRKLGDFLYIWENGNCPPTWLTQCKGRCAIVAVFALDINEWRFSKL